MEEERVYLGEERGYMVEDRSYMSEEHGNCTIIFDQRIEAISAQYPLKEIQCLRF